MSPRPGLVHRLPGTLVSDPVPLDDLVADGYKVFAAVGRPGTYLVLPRRYRVDGQPPAGVPTYLTGAHWSDGSRSSTPHTTSHCPASSRQPSIRTSGTRTWPRSGPRYGTAPLGPTLLLPTSFGWDATTFTATQWNTSVQIKAVLAGDTIHVDAAMDYADAVTLNEMLSAAASEGQLVGNAQFALSDSSTLGPVELHADVTRLTGPWPGLPACCIRSLCLSGR